ncbi:hypothetical protein GCM10009818_36920 [Nakamurella flavida]
MSHEVVPAGTYRRTALERADQRVSWERSDEAFFAAGACHILAYRCVATHTGVVDEVMALRKVDDGTVTHVLAARGGWLFDFSGWHRADAVVEANQRFEKAGLELVRIDQGLQEFCAENAHRAPHQYHRDPTDRADQYLRRFTAPHTRPLAAPADLELGRPAR